MDPENISNTSGDSNFTDAELSERYDKWVEKTWFIRATYVDGDENMEEIGTGFAVSSHGLVVTCAHVIQEAWSRNGKIKAHMIKDTKFYNVDVLCYRPKWDIAVLLIRQPKLCKYAKLAADGSLPEGMTLFHIGNGDYLVGSFYTGMVSYKCIDEVRLPLDKHLTCEEHSPRTIDIPQEYKIMGDMYDKYMVLDEFQKQFHPHVPLVGLSGIDAVRGCSGGPLFNEKGKIVGMIAGGDKEFSYAIHVAALHKVVDDAVKRFKKIENHKLFKAGFCNLFKRQISIFKRKELHRPNGKGKGKGS